MTYLTALPRPAPGLVDCRPRQRGSLSPQTKAAAVRRRVVTGFPASASIRRAAPELRNSGDMQPLGEP